MVALFTLDFFKNIKFTHSLSVSFPALVNGSPLAKSFACDGVINNTVGECHAHSRAALQDVPKEYRMSYIRFAHVFDGL